MSREKKQKNKYFYIDKISKIITWIIVTLIVIFFGIFVYTPEYNGTENNQNSMYLYKGLKTYLNKIVNFELSILMISLIILILLLIITQIIQKICGDYLNLKDNIRTIEEENLHLKEKLKEDYSRYNEKDKKEEIIKKMNMLMSNFSDIISIQMYECIESKKKSLIEFEIRPTKYYYTKSNEVANLIHEKYSISECSINEYLKIKEAYNKGDYDLLEEYIKKLVTKLQNKFLKNPQKITEAIINDYCLLTLALQLDFDEVAFTIDGLNSDFQKRINKAKRNGFLRGVIEKNFYKFTHLGDSNKGNRVYITRCLDIESIPHMFVIILQSSFANNEYFDDIANEIGEAFYKMLENDLDLVYNNIKIS